MGCLGATCLRPAGAAGPDGQRAGVGILPSVIEALIQVFPNPTLFDLGPLHVGWYGVGYVVGVAVLLYVAQQEIVRRGIERRHVMNALLVVAALALIGGRLYHVIDQWGYYSQNLPAIVLPPYAGLGLYGGLIGGMAGIWLYTKRNHLAFWDAVDSVVAGALFAQGVAPRGELFHPGVYGPPPD